MKISVILTSYNHEKFLAESIESVLNQTYKDFEFIIVDDCSKDSSWQIIEKYKNDYPEIQILRHEYNWGNGVVADIVKNHTSGEYIAIHHSDDLWEADKLEKQIAVFREHPEYAAVFTNASAIDEEGNPYEDESGFYYNLFQVENRSRHQWLNHFFFHGNCLCHPSILVKKSVYEEDGFFRKGLKQIPDFVKWIQICKKYEIYVIPEVLVKFRIRAAGMNTSGMRADTQIRSTVELFLMLQEYADIRDTKEFLDIFPEARKYDTGRDISTGYILGRLCTEEGMPPYTRIFGIQQLYKALNSEDQAEQMQIGYSFSANDFAKMNAQYDLFGMLPKAFEQNRSIYYDCGNGYNAENVVRQRYTLGQELTFRMHVIIQVPDDRGIRKLRFDPAENVLIRSKIEHIVVNGENIEFQAENALLSKNSDDIFINPDPIYELKLPQHLAGLRQMNVEIRGKISRLNDNEIGDIVTEFMYSSRDEKNEIAEKYRFNALQTEKLLADRKELERNCEIISDELDKALCDKGSLEKQYKAISDELKAALECKTELEKEYGIVSDELNKTVEYKAGLEKEHESASSELRKVSKSMKELEENYNTILNELNEVKSARWYRIWRKYRKMRERRQRSE